MPDSIANIVLSIGGLSIVGQITRSGEGQVSAEVSLPAADAGTLSTRTSDTAGTLTLEAGHSIETGDVIDIFWYASGVLKCARNATVGTVAAESVPFTGASGDALPTLDSAITADERVNILGEVDFDGDEAVMFAMMSTRDGHRDVVDATPTTLDQAKLLANAPWFWFEGMSTNPLTGNPVDDIWATNADSNNAAVVKFGARLDTVP